MARGGSGYIRHHKESNCNVASAQTRHRRRESTGNTLDPGGIIPSWCVYSHMAQKAMSVERARH